MSKCPSDASRMWTLSDHGLESEAGFTALAQGFGKLAKSVVGGREVRKEPGSPRENQSEPLRSGRIRSRITFPWSRLSGLTGEGIVFSCVSS